MSERAVSIDAPREQWFSIGKLLVGVGPKKTRVFSRHRDLDWWMAWFAFAVGIYLLQPALGAATIGTEGSWTRGLSAVGWGVVLIILSVVRYAAIRINGRWQTGISALIRGSAALISAVFWMQWLYAVLKVDVLRDPFVVSLSAALLAWAWSADVRCVIRSIDDMLAIRRGGKMAKANIDGSR